MKKRIAMLLACCLLASCAATGETVSTPEASTPAPAASAETPFSPVIPTPTPTPEPVPAPNRGDLTEEQVEQVNQAFEESEEKDGITYTSEVNGFFTSYYADVRELDFAEFLRYYPSGGEVGEEDLEEFAALAELPGFPWKKEYFAESGLTPSRLPVPTHRILRSSVDATLQKYAGITTADLKNTDNTLYLPEYDAYYNFTSDFGPGSFHCEGGRVTEDTALLWSEELYGEGIRQKLTLQKEGEDWYIRSFLQVTVEK